MTNIIDDYTEQLEWTWSVLNDSDHPCHREMFRTLLQLDFLLQISTACMWIGCAWRNETLVLAGSAVLAAIVLRGESPPKTSHKSYRTATTTREDPSV